MNEVKIRENPWPDNHKGHWWSGWPGAYCLRCGASDPMEEAIADGHYDAWDNQWTKESYKLEFERRNICPADKG